MNKLLRRFRQMRSSKGVEGWESFDDFLEWYKERAEKIPSERKSVNRIDTSKPSSPWNCYVSASNGKNIVAKKRVAKYIRQITYRDGSVSYSVYIKTKKIERGRGGFLTLEDAKKFAEECILSINARVYTGEILGKKIVVYDDGPGSPLRYKLVVDGYPCGWYRTIEEAKQAIPEESPNAIEQMRRFRLTGQNDITKIDNDEINRFCSPTIFLKKNIKKNKKKL